LPSTNEHLSKELFVAGLAAQACNPSGGKRDDLNSNSCSCNPSGGKHDDLNSNSCSSII